MTKNILKSFLTVSICVALFSFDVPTGWGKAGSKPKSYEMSIDKGSGQDGKNAATIKSIDQTIDGFGTLMQQSGPANFLGKRVRMTGYAKSENVANWAGLWLRVDQSGSQEPLSFDNMGDRPIKGNTRWTKYEIVLDVSEQAVRIAYGALLDGTGQIWFDNIAFEIVDANIPVTGKANNIAPKKPKDPTNLDFEK